MNKQKNKNEQKKIENKQILVKNLRMLYDIKKNRKNNTRKHSFWWADLLRVARHLLVSFSRTYVLESNYQK